MNQDDTLPADTVDATSSSTRTGSIQTIGRFAVEAKLGEGGMGVVLLATDPLLGRRVAIKLLRGDSIDDSAKRRLLREAQATARLSHENVIVVHEVGTHDDQIYVAMEYVAGETLRSRQAHHGWREVVELYARAGRGLLAAHDAGLVHRDFKPDNVLVGDDGRLRVTDFGLVAATNAATEPVSTEHRESELGSRLTQTGAIMGTPRYMAPEQHRGDPVDARADQFAFCASLYEALYGQPPFAGATYAELAANVVAGTLAPLPPSDVPPRIRDGILRGLNRDRSDRHASIRDLLPLLSSPARRRWPLVAGVAAGLIAVATVALVVASRPNTRPASAVEGSTSQLDVASLKRANMAFDEGRTSFRAGKYDDAARSFEGGYAALKAPQMLFNAGASYYMTAKRDGDASRYRRAAERYTSYLASDPIAPGVADAIESINLEAARLEAGGDRTAPSPAIRSATDPLLRGLLVVISDPPGATVYVDDPAKGPVGTTPWSGTLDGKHTIYLAKPDYTQMEYASTYDAHEFLVFRGTLKPIAQP